MAVSLSNKQPKLNRRAPGGQTPPAAKIARTRSRSSCVSTPAAGATVAAALRVAEQAGEGEVVLAMLPDTGERYLSTALFEGVNEGSDEDWLATL